MGKVQVLVPLDPNQAFDIFVNQIDTWWPRKGIFPFSFAPKSTHPLHIQFEPHLNGRMYETFMDGTEYEIGVILEWQPPNKLIHTWRDPTWEGETMRTITFVEDQNGTKVNIVQDGFAAIGQPEMAPYYDVGNRQTMAGFQAHCIAIHEIDQLGQVPFK